MEGPRLPFKQTLKHASLRALSALERSRDIPLSEIRHFLLLQHASALGTVVHATPLIPALRAAVPDAHIIAAASGFGLEILAGNPGIDEVVAMPNPVHAPLAAARALRRLKLNKPFATLTPVGNERTAIALAAWRGGAENRAGHTVAPELYRAPLSFDFAQSQIRNNLRILTALGHAPAELQEPQVFFGDSDRSYAEGLLASRSVSAPLAVFVTQTSPTQRKSWRPERFVAAARFLVDRFGAEIVFVGTPTESAAIETIRRQIRGRTWNVAGKTGVKQLAALLSLCDAALTLDTGTMHLGRAVGLPMTIIAPAWSPPLEWLPLNDPRFTILKNAEMDRATPDYIIDEVSVEEVTASLADLLARYPRGSRQRIASSSR